MRFPTVLDYCDSQQLARRDKLKTNKSGASCAHPFVYHIWLLTPQVYTQGITKAIRYCAFTWEVLRNFRKLDILLFLLLKADGEISDEISRNPRCTLLLVAERSEITPVRVTRKECDIIKKNLKKSLRHNKTIKFQVEAPLTWGGRTKFFWKKINKRKMKTVASWFLFVLACYSTH